MKGVLLILVCFALVMSVWSAVARYPKVPGKPGDCWSSKTGSMSKGEKKDIKGECSQAECTESGLINLYTCGAVNGATKGDNSKVYPLCCPGGN